MPEQEYGNAPTVKRIVCLANSRKEGDRCIAGKEILKDGRSGGWVRPVSDRGDEAVNAFERQYRDRSEPRVLDVVDVPLLEARPSAYQAENWLLDPHSIYPHHFWRKVRCVTLDDLPQFTDSAGPLWINGHSSDKGRNDRIPLYLANTLDDSLRLIQVDRLELSTSNAKHKQNVLEDSPYRVQGRFRYDGEEYWLSVTDPIYEQACGRQPNSRYALDACFLTISLGGPHKNFAYKLIAAVIAPSEPSVTDAPSVDTAQIPLFTF